MTLLGWFFALYIPVGILAAAFWWFIFNKEPKDYGDIALAILIVLMGWGGFLFFMCVWLIMFIVSALSHPFWKTPIGKQND